MGEMHARSGSSIAHALLIRGSNSRKATGGDRPLDVCLATKSLTSRIGTTTVILLNTCTASAGRGKTVILSPRKSRRRSTPSLCIVI